MSYFMHIPTGRIVFVYFPKIVTISGDSRKSWTNKQELYTYQLEDEKSLRVVFREIPETVQIDKTLTEITYKSFTITELHRSQSMRLQSALPTVANTLSVTEDSAICLFLSKQPYLMEKSFGGLSQEFLHRHPSAENPFAEARPE